MTEIFDPQIADNLYRFVMFNYPWGKPNTPLQNFQGPRSWQRDELQEKTEHIANNRARMARGEKPQVWRKATASGRGPGKSALVAWETDWMRSTRLGSTTIVTANTETQLKSRTFAEITKWATMGLNAHWFETSVLAVRPAPWFKELVEKQLGIDCGYYYVQGQLWSDENPDAFAGVHNPLGVNVIFDEASGVPASIFKVTEGFFTEPTLDRYWDIYSNPRRNSGGFYECFHEYRKYWQTRHIDSRTVEGTDTELFERMIEQYGIDSDTVRVEVLGQFPHQGANQFISSQIVYDAQQRDMPRDDGAPLIMGIDIARFGDDETCIRWRQGRDARTFFPVRFKNRDNMFVANEIAKLIDQTNPDAVCIDAGNGTGVIDRLRELKYRVHEVWFGGKSGDKRWANKRTEMYNEVREWLPGGMIDKDPILFRDLTTPEFEPFGKAQDAMMLESKESMKNRGIPSPNDGDALALTFAVKVARKDLGAGASRKSGRAKGVDYELFRS